VFSLFPIHNTAPNQRFGTRFSIQVPKNAPLDTQALLSCESAFNANKTNQNIDLQMYMNFHGSYHVVLHTSATNDYQKRQETTQLHSWITTLPLPKAVKHHIQDTLSILSCQYDEDPTIIKLTP
jgi:hypothetical protein